jgi:hypothetical protein
MHFMTTKIKSLKKFFLTSGVVKNVFWCISWSTESKSLKNYFLASGVVKNVFWCIFRTPESSPLKKTFFNVWSGRKRVFMHLCVLPDHHNQVLKKLFFSPLEWLKTCFDAFPDHQNQVLEKLFLNVWSGSKRVFKHFRILPDHQNQVIRKFFFHLCSG